MISFPGSICDSFKPFLVPSFVVSLELIMALIKELVVAHTIGRWNFEVSCLLKYLGLSLLKPSTYPLWSLTSWVFHVSGLLGFPYPEVFFFPKVLMCSSGWTQRKTKERMYAATVSAHHITVLQKNPCDECSPISS